MAQDQIAKQPNLVWVDCEMTGLDTERDALVEIRYAKSEFHGWVKWDFMGCLEIGKILRLQSKKKKKNNAA